LAETRVTDGDAASDQHPRRRNGVCELGDRAWIVIPDQQIAHIAGSDSPELFSTRKTFL
jgi:hypothetical protein